MHTKPKRQTSARARLSSGDCGCGSGWTASYTAAGSALGERARFSFGVLERPKYRARQLMTPEILQLEADYFRDRMRRHNMFVHGWGVVCGALVCVVPRKGKPRTDPRFERQASSLRSANPYQAVNGNGNGAENGDGQYEPWLVRVQPGYILGPHGDEILIDQPVDVPLRGSGLSGCGADSGDDLADPWCSEVFVDRRTDPFYIAVRYRECPVLPVRAQPSGCGCDDEPCEYSRYRDSFEIGFLDCCPDDQNRENSSPDLDDDRNPFCPDCPESPWVVLAQLTVNADGVVTMIDNCSCRRVMVTTRDMWFSCSGTDCDQFTGDDGSTPPGGEEPGIDGSVTTEPTPGDSTGDTSPAGDGTGGPRPGRGRPQRRRSGN